MMRTIGIALAGCFVAACTVGEPAPAGDDTGGAPDAGPGGGNPDASGSAACKVAATTPDLGPVTPLATERRNQPGSQGALKYYVSYADNGGARFQIELWEQLGGFSAGPVVPGTYPLTGSDADYNLCGACAIALGDPTSPTPQIYIGTGGSITVTSVGDPGTTLAVSADDVTFSEIDPTTGALKPAGCGAQLVGIDLSGIIVDVTTGGGGGGGGGGG